MRSKNLYSIFSSQIPVKKTIANNTMFLIKSHNFAVFHKEHLYAIPKVTHY